MFHSKRKTAAIILAAGKGTRMKSDLAKVLHPLSGRPMIHYVMKTALEIHADPIVVVVGHQKDRVKEELHIYPVRFAVQEPQLGTAHAVTCALLELQEIQGSVLILSGDVPLIRTSTLTSLLNYHTNNHSAATVMTAQTNQPKGYGRILRKADGDIAAIVEERDATDAIRAIQEINSGIYVFELESLRRVLPEIGIENDQKEYYLTDAVKLLVAGGESVAAFKGDFHEVMGINTIAELASAEEWISHGNFDI
jgi:UDP-N-acetylglucosamine diphosphorylase/glucosamine-1-phosphate N-acetyltransferase